MQPVVVVVLEQMTRGEGDKKTLALSMRGSLLHKGLSMQHLVEGFPVSGCVSSKEDHGYIISGGISGVNFFLPYKAVPESVGGQNLPIGE